MMLDRRQLFRAAAAAALPLFLRPAFADETPVATRSFALDLYRAVASRTRENVALSPWSVSTALSMTLPGAAGECKAELERALGVRDGLAYHREAGALSRELQALEGVSLG